MRIFFGTLIGYHVEIIFSSNRNYEGINGIVLDETKNTFLIRNLEGRIMRIPKKGTVFKFSLGEDEYIFKGDKLTGDVVKRVIRI